MKSEKLYSRHARIMYIDVGSPFESLRRFEGLPKVAFDFDRPPSSSPPFVAAQQHPWIFLPVHILLLKDKM